MRAKIFFLLLLLLSASIACAGLWLGEPNGPPSSQTAVQATLDPDPDHDGILGDKDQCPDSPENLNNIFDTDGCPDTLQNLVDLATQDIDRFWRGEFQEGNFSYTSPAAITGYSDSQPVETSCGESIPENAFYCPLDNSIYY